MCTLSSISLLAAFYIILTAQITQNPDVQFGFQFCISCLKLDIEVQVLSDLVVYSSRLRLTFFDIIRSLR